jgi:hypothetical protein
MLNLIRAAAIAVGGFALASCSGVQGIERS